MGSQKSRKSDTRAALAPQRRRGQLRVAALLQAGTEVFAARGYGAATMAEVAARAGSPIGSLYRFFPHKEALADALLDRCGERLEDALKAIEARAADLTPAQIADALIDVWLDLRDVRSAAAALLDARSSTSTRRRKLRRAMRERVARILLACRPRLARPVAARMATLLVQHMKYVAALIQEEGAASPGIGTECRAMCRFYLEERLGS